MTAQILRPGVSIILFTSKTFKSKPGYHPVSLRVTYGGQRKYYTIGHAKESEWDGSRFKKQFIEKNLKLNAIEKKANSIILELSTLESGFTFDRFSTAMFHDSSLKYVLEFMDHLIEKLVEQDRASTLDAIKTLRNHLHQFRKGKDFAFIELDNTFLEKFEKYLLTPHKARHHKQMKSCTRNGVAFYMRQLKSVYNNAVRKGVAREADSPFKKYKITTVDTAKRALRKEHIQAIINYPAEEGTWLFHHRNIFAFSYLCRGMNLTDIAKLRESNLTHDRIQYIRSKTKAILDIPIRGLTREIVNYYRKNHFTGSGYLFPILSKEYDSEKALRRAIKARMKKLNKDLKLMAKNLGIPNAEEITSYVSRHSWATNTKKQGGSIAMIQQGLGHENIRTTETYLAQFENEELDKVDDFIEKEFSSLKINRNAS